MECTQKYEQQLHVLRAEITKAKAAYHLELADETNRRLGQQSSRSRKSVDAKQESVRALEKRYESLQRSMLDEVAYLQRGGGAALRVYQAVPAESTTASSSVARSGSSTGKSTSGEFLV